MNIFLMTETNSGCYRWRGAIPAKYLARRGHEVQILSDDSQSAEAPDVMVFYRAHFPQGVKILDWCKKNRIRVVFDTDDALELVPPENLNYHVIQPRLDVYQRLLSTADVVTTTTPTLANHLRAWNRNVVVIPNSVDPEDWPARTPAKTGKVRIGWTGSATHFADLTVALDAIRELQKKNSFKLVLQGICMEPTLQELVDFLDARWGKRFFETPVGRAIRRFMQKLEGIDYEFQPMVPIQAHPAKVCDLALDIGIAPLADDRFNRHKSCIKYYEYAMAGAVTLASHVLPYSEEVPTTAKNNRESWKFRLESLLRADRDSQLQAERNWVLQHRNIETAVEQWERVLAGENSLESAVPEPVLTTTSGF
jgi:hypothetical protein